MTPCTHPTDLAHWMSAPATTVSSYVKRFEQRGHVQRDPNPDDGRSYRVALTVAGRRAHAEAGDLFRPVLNEITRRLGDDVLKTHQRLQALHDATAAMGTTNQRAGTARP
jgi:DNA-binding MarR family transcriptional regulator